MKVVGDQYTLELRLSLFASNKRLTLKTTRKRYSPVYMYIGHQQKHAALVSVQIGIVQCMGYLIYRALAIGSVIVIVIVGTKSLDLNI